jgi:predicted RNA-binding Zn-ribbon protein involved in translation (DUF1610 family)
MTNPMNDIKFNCPQCGQHLAVDATGAGTTVACPQCGQAIIVPRAVAPCKPSKLLWIAPLLVVATALVGLGCYWMWLRHEPQRLAGGVGTNMAANTRGEAKIADALLSPARAANRLYPVTLQAGKSGYINAAGEIVVEPQFATARPFSEGFGAVSTEGKWGFVNTAGKLVIPARYDECTAFSEGYCAVEVEGKWGFIDTQGALLTNWFDRVRPFSEGMAAVQVGQKWGYVNHTMEPVVPASFDGAWDFTEGLAPVKAGKRWGFINPTGQMVIAPVYYYADNFSEGLAYVEGGPNNRGYIDKSGQLVVTGQFYDAHPFSAGLAAVLTTPGSVYGLIDKSGKMVVEPQFDDVGLFSEGLAPVEIKFKWGFLNTNGSMLIKPLYSFAERFADGLAYTSDGKGGVGYIGKSGKFCWTNFLVRSAQPTENTNAPTVSPRRIRNPVMNVQLSGPTELPPKQVTLVGNPFRKRFPDGTKVSDKPSAFARNVWDMIYYEGRIYLGSGDYWNNSGPTDIYSFVPGQNQFTLDYSAPDEMVSKFYIFEGKLVVPGNDPQESWEFGNIYIKEAGRWRKVRTIPNGLHCFQLAYADGNLLAAISTEHQPKLLRSRDWGKTWEPVVFKSFPTTLFTMDNQLCAFDRWNSLCRYENGILYSEMSMPQRALLQEDRLARTYPGWQCAHAEPFANGLLLSTASLVLNLQYGPYPLLFMRPGDPEPYVLDFFQDKIVIDTCVSGGVFYALCTRKAGDGFENAIYATRDVKTWQCCATFKTPSFARSFVEAKGDFYVSIGSRGFTSEVLPNSTGDILRVIPTR